MPANDRCQPVRPADIIQRGVNIQTSFASDNDLAGYVICKFYPDPISANFAAPLANRDELDIDSLQADIMLVDEIQRPQTVTIFLRL